MRELEGGWRGGGGEGKQGTWLDLERGGVLLIDRDTKISLNYFLCCERYTDGVLSSTACNKFELIDVFGSS